MTCVQGCGAKYGVTAAPGAFGSCVTGGEGQCPAVLCDSICEGSADSKCIGSCERYRDRMVFGPGGGGAKAPDFFGYMDSCVLEKDDLVVKAEGYKVETQC